MANDQNRDQFDNQDKDPTAQSDQSQTTGQQGQDPSSDMSGGTLGQGQSGGFGNQTSATPETGEASGQFETAESGDTALDTRTDAPTGQAGQSETGEQSGSFVGSQGGTGSDDYLRNNENQETAQKSNESETDIDGTSNL